MGNVLLWVFVFLHLKKKLSPKGIVKDARKELEALLLQINSASDRNIRLIQEQISQLKHAASDAEALCGKVEGRIAMLYGEMEKLSAVKAVEERLYQTVSQSDAIKEKPLPSEAGGLSVEEKVSVPKEQDVPVSKRLLQEDTLNKSYTPVDSYVKEQMRFTAAEDKAGQELVEKRSDMSHVENIPEFVQAENPIEVQKSFKQQVLEMKALGYSIEEIAHETGRSTQEVKITIEIS